MSEPISPTDRLFVPDGLIELLARRARWALEAYHGVSSVRTVPADRECMYHINVLDNLCRDYLDKRGLMGEYKALEMRYATLTAEVQATHEENARLRKRIAELRRTQERQA